jgi:diaminopropionate ammonia-lyase
MRVIANPLAGTAEVWSPYTRAPLEFHRRLPGYEPTPLLDVPSLATLLGVGRVLVKYERSRWGLPAFKMLGASWATYRALVDRAGTEPAWESLEDLRLALKPLQPLTLAAATDGNHGRAVARMARLLGFDAHIFVPADMTAARRQAIAGEGATVTIVDGDYDDAVARSAAERGGLVISDTSWPGYEQVPRWVIEGYSTMFFEISEAPSVVVVPIGVGALAAAAVNHWARQGAMLVGVEPIDANCVMASAEAGHLTRVSGPHRSIMVGLNCGMPSPVAWPLVSKGVGTLVAVDDEAARRAVDDLAAVGIEAGDTGASGLAGLTALQASHLRLDSDATVLVLVTESR